LSIYVVNSLTDTGSGSRLEGDLRYCLTKATSGNDTITFASTLQGTINVQSELPTLNASVAIQGPGDNPGGLGSRLNVDNGQFFVGSTATVAISGLGIYSTAIENDGGTLIVSGCNIGTGGLGNSGTATVSDCYFFGNSIDNYGMMTISNSICEGEYGAASGITNSGMLTVNYSTFYDIIGSAVSNQGTVDINNHTLTGNAGMGAGIYMSAGTLNINSSTLAGNSTMGDFGGGLYIAGGTASINNSTFADNQGLGGDIYNAAGPSALQMYDTILADDMIGSVTSLGHNLINNLDGSGFAASDLLNVNPLLGPLQDNGGASAGVPLAQHVLQTMALLPGSPAIDAGDNTNAPAYDQRGPGFPRIVNGTIDIGAFEVQSGSSTQASNLTVVGFPSATTAGGAGSFTVTAQNADGTTDTSYTGTVHFTSSDGQAVLPADYTFTAADAGVHTFSATLLTAGTQSLTATDTTTGSLTGSETGITVKAAAASTIIVTGFPSPTTAGVAGSFTVTLRDLYGNIASGYTGTVHFTSSDAKAALPGNYTFTAADAGQHTFSATLKTAGTQSLTATDTTSGNLASTDAGITVNPAAASKFIFTAPASVTAGASFSLTLTVEDAYGNVVTGYAGTVHFSSTDSKATLPSNYTFKATDKGRHTFTGLVLRKTGNQKITITDTHNSSLTGNVIVDVL